MKAEKTQTEIPSRTIQTESDRGRVYIEDNRSEAAMLNILNQIIQSKSVNSFSHTKNKENKVIQCLSLDYYDRAEIRYGNRAFAHINQEAIEESLMKYHKEIVVGQNQTILIGGGRQTGYDVYGCIKYNCEYNEDIGRHIIFVFHAHAQGRMG